MIAGLLASANASAYYISGSTVYDSSNNPQSGEYTYTGYYLDSFGLPIFGTYYGYIGNIHTLSPPAGISKGSIGTPYLVDPYSQATAFGSGGYVNNFDAVLPNEHWYRFTSDVASILDVYYEWGRDVDGFSLELFEYGGSDTAIAAATFLSGDINAHLDVLGFTSIAAGDYLIRIVGSATGSLNTYSVYLGATPVPLPPAVLLFISALAGFGVIGRRKTRQAVS